MPDTGCTIQWDLREERKDHDHQEAIARSIFAAKIPSAKESRAHGWLGMEASA